MPKVGVVGLGYVGVTLMAALALAGFEVHGVDVLPAVLESLRRGKPHLFEPGVEEVFNQHVGKSIFVSTELPEDLDVAVISVSTPVNASTREPDLRNLAAAAESIAKRCSPGTLVVVRSTVPIGASREIVLPALLAGMGSAQLVMAPERTIQGQALRELVELPQIVGGLDAASLDRGLRLFGRLCKHVVPVTSLETAELVKLTNNCHTDVIYAFGNEVAMLTESLGLDPLEVVRATNLDYPRPDIARPGYVGGGCLSKDPYIMISAAKRTGHLPRLVRAARTLNEALPAHVAQRVADLMHRNDATTLAVLGWAYKGRPPTDDMRGTPIAEMMPVFREANIQVLGHDPIVREDVIHAYGGEPVGLEAAFQVADAVLVITDHPRYRELDIAQLLTDSPVRLVYDSWRVLDAEQILARGVRYAGIGYEAAA
ncbi:UDP-N-acetyl-D-mannosaminuronic acid dehydrogenase [Kribbella aluminosa]|uniref:UDP-N-acetyl-D-mannosaminuronic acid dehydrogenase n=1 Tax=Kribbella aluminosa TaxID=416017 RepID=A0ABS4UDC0_9ACTN|nr:nucleotide sugar dehydrogenase [Kribbella aluminosa]MBP2349637.1 UDP-N-acetyl-D-mannosaminuronic acid dehydrogenase [Kribbella aluminosa]